MTLSKIKQIIIPPLSAALGTRTVVRDFLPPNRRQCRAKPSRDCLGGGFFRESALGPSPRTMWYRDIIVVPSSSSSGRTANNKIGTWIIPCVNHFRNTEKTTKNHYSAVRCKRDCPCAGKYRLPLHRPRSCRRHPIDRVPAPLTRDIVAKRKVIIYTRLLSARVSRLFGYGVTRDVRLYPRPMAYFNFLSGGYNSDK